jgi:hypothetical protein
MPIQTKAFHKDATRVMIATMPRLPRASAIKSQTYLISTALTRLGLPRIHNVKHLQ